MMDRFEELGLGPEMLSGAESLGWTIPTGIQKDAVPVIRRGNNVVLHASAGSGATGAWGLGVLDRLAGEEATASPGLLVLTDDPDTATRVSESLALLALPAGLAVRSEGPGWTERDVDVLVLTPAAAAAAVRASALKLDGLRALVVRDLDTLLETGQHEDLETVVDIIPSDAQRVAVTGRLSQRVDSYIERHVRRAMTVPPRTDPRDASGPRLRYRIVTERDKAGAVIELLDADATEVAVICRTAERAERLERDLEARGAAQAGPRVRVLTPEDADRRSTKAAVVSADVPFDAETLAAVHARGGAVLVTADEREHLHRIAARAGIALDALPDPGSRPGAPERIRERIRATLRDQDLTAELALIAPLLDELPAAEVAAAAMRLARESADRAPTGDATRVASSAPPPEGAPTWTHLFLGVGTRDGLGPGDIVGAMTGEAGISGDQVGKIDLRESHTTVEVATPVARQVIDALNGRTLGGRSLRVDYDRKSRPSGQGGRAGGSKGGSRRGRSRGGPGDRR